MTECRHGLSEDCPGCSQDASAYWAQISADYEARIAELLAEVAALKRQAQPCREALLAAQSALNNPINMNLRDRAFRAINLALAMRGDGT